MIWRQQYHDPEGDEMLGQLDGIVCGEAEDKTLQQFREECDLNAMLKRFGVTGQIATKNAEPQYGDFSAVTDYQEALNTVIAANAAFEALPSEVRNRFQNNPGEIVDFVSNEANREEAVRLGLVPKPRTPEVVPVPVEGNVTE